MGRGHVHHHYDDNDDDEYIAKHPASASSTEDDVDDPFTFLLDSAEPPRQQQAVPLYAYPLLAASVIAVSSAATVFTSMAEVPPITLAAWRLQLTTVMQAPFGVVQLLRLPLNLRHKCMQSVRMMMLLVVAGFTMPTQHMLTSTPPPPPLWYAQWLILAFAGVSMALHFAFWVWGLEHTSLVHALLLVSMSPVCIALGTWAMRQPISRGEQVGALLGLAGGGVLAQGAAEASAAAKEQSGDTSQPATVAGDVACAAACVSVIGYLYAGRHLRAWMPIFVYATIVTGIAAILLMITAVLAEGASVSAGGGDGLFGWVVDGHYAWRVVYLAIGPGIVGHTGVWVGVRERGEWPNHMVLCENEYHSTCTQDSTRCFDIFHHWSWHWP